MPVIAFVRNVNERNKQRQRQIDALEQRCKVLEAKPSVEYCGVFQSAVRYSPGSIVTRSGGLWLCLADTVNHAPGAPDTAAYWRLICKEGRA